MKMAHSMQGIYAPLPQSLSDSESEKEISMEPICTSYNSKNSNNFEETYRQNGHSLRLDEDMVKIKRGASKMSTARKIAFALSIALCFLPIFIFLWVLPCTELHTCPIKITNWEYKQENIELKGPINLVRGVYETNMNLAIMYKGSINSPKVLKHGILSFMGLTGNVAWDFEQDVEPLALDCSIVDTNNDGILDCLMVDSKGLKAIETLSGGTLWHAHSEVATKLIRKLEMPISIGDLNNDKVDELLSGSEEVGFLIISGQNGQALLNIPIQCDKVKEIRKPSKDSDYFTYNCINGTNPIEKYKVRLEDIRKVFTDPASFLTIEKVTDKIKNGVFSVGNRKLTVENGANCPKCKSILTLSDENDQILKTWTYNNTYILSPRRISFKPTNAMKAKFRGHLDGFMAKIWKWSEHYKKLRPTQRINKRSVQYSSANETFYSTEVTERVFLLTFNNTDFHEINAFSNEIHQICNKYETNCQPSVENQEDSLLLEDVENDSSLELVSYYSSYDRRGEDWYLTSNVKVFRLEEELPKLYGNK